MQRAEPPQARLAFHVAVPPTAVPSPQLSLWSLWPHPKPHSHPAQVAGNDKLLLDLQGEFGLEPNGGVKIAGRSFSIDRGTLVSRGFGAGVRGRDGPSLWWSGSHEEHRGIFTLFLLGADEADLLAVHRILLFLPPVQMLPIITPRSTSVLTRRIPLPTHRTLGAQDPITELQHSFARMNTAQPQYRNSLLLVDPATDEVISILPLDSLGTDLDSAPNSSPQKTSAPPSPAHKHTPSFDLAVTPNRARGLTLAEQVNEISSHMAGQPRSYAEYGDERSRTRARERDGEDDGIPDNGRRRRVPRDEVCEEAEEDEIEGYYINRVMREVRGSKELYTNTGDDDEEMGENTLKKLQRGLLLDDQMDSLEEYRSPPLVPDQRLRKSRSVAKEPPTSAVPLPASPDSAPVAESVSSPCHIQHQPSPSSFTLATIDTGSRYATVTEGYYQAQEDCRASSATFSTALEEADENDEPPSISQNDVKAPSPNPYTLSQSPQHIPSPSVLSAAPSHALTPSNDNSNSVLLRFLGGESKITAQPINEADIEREGLVRATVDASEVDSGGGWAWLGLLVGGWSTWLSGWWSAAPAPAAASATVPRSRPRRANGEGGTGRLSVLYFDENGLGRTAYIEGARGGLSGRGLGGRW